MYIYAIAVYAWTALSLGWIVFDLIAHIEAWLNFTSWVWTLQAIFFCIHAVNLNTSQEKNKSTYSNSKQLEKLSWDEFIETFLLPVVFATEWTTAIAVVYMMVTRAELLLESIDTYGAIATWIGSFILHYLTVVMLFWYMLHRRIYNEEKFQTIQRNLSNYTKSHYYQLLGMAVFFIVYSYVLIQSPASHYGVSNTTDNEASIIMILTSLIGVLVFHYWLQDSSW